MEESPAPMATCVFLPGGIAPAAARYAPLIQALGQNVDARTKELELYAFSPPLDDYSVAWEVESLELWRARAGLDRFHLYAHSGGGAVALAFTATHPERVLSLALDEPAFDFSAEMLADLRGHVEVMELMTENPREGMSRFMRLELAEGVEFQPAPGAPPPLPNRPAGLAALLRAFTRDTIDHDALARFDRPVIYTRGSLSAPRYARSAARLSTTFTNFEEVVFDGLHHLNTSHQAEPERVAAMLSAFWDRAE